MAARGSVLEEPIEATAVTHTLPYYATKLARHGLPSKLMDEPHPATHAFKAIRDQHSMDFSHLLNTSSYVNVVFEDQEEEVAKLGMRVNLADQTVYTQSFDLHNRTLGIVADLWHCPEPEGEENHTFAGACTVGSTEACLLSGLAHKFRWRQWYQRRTPGATKASVRAILPNVVISTQFQAAWEKFFKYMDVQPKFVTPSIKDFKLTASGVEAAIDEHTLFVVCILGNHYGGQYDPVWEINDVVERVNQEKGFQVGIHVDAASGGFIAPFQPEVPAWDFRLKNVLSISASGHKFGESCAGTGWVVFRQRQDLAEHVAISVSYLGGHGESYTLNFSRPATGVYVQFYKFLRHGRLGYQNLTDNMMHTSKFIRDRMKEMKAPNGKTIFRILDDGDQACLPVVTAMIDKDAELPFDDIDLQHVLAMEHWYVSGYAQNFHDPDTEETLPLFSDSPADGTMFRIVVKSNLTHPMAVNLVDSIQRSIQFLVDHGKGFEKMHRNDTTTGKKKHHKKNKGHQAC